MPTSDLEATVGLSAEGVGAAFPFHVVCAPDGTILQVGPALADFLGSDARGSALRELLETRRPRNVDPTVATSPDTAWLFSVRDTPLQLRGTVVHEADRVLLLTSPAIRTQDELAASGVSLTALASHDPTPDHLFATKALELALSQSRDLADELREHNDALELARQEADQANEAQSRFLATMSHEIRTPLTALLGLAELLEDEIANLEHRRMAGTIRRSGRLLMSVLDDVLDYARLDKGKLELDARVVDPTEVLRSTVEVFAQEASNADLGLTWSTRGDIPEFVVLDEARVGQVLGNLVANAIKFTRWGAIHLSLHATPLGGGGTTLTYAVSDTGVGIPKDRLGEIFEPFTQSGPHARRHGGSGLGLSICRRLAEHMNGELSAVSAPGIGSTFRLRLPAEVVDEAPPDHQDATDLAESLDGLHVLIVDDNSVNRFVVRKMLHSLGAEVSEAASGEEALAWLSRSEADVVLLDIEMPGMDGYDTCRHLRAREDEPNIVIALSAYALPEHEERAMEVGIDGYMHKPTTRALLSSTILHHVGDAQVAPVA